MIFHVSLRFFLHLHHMGPQPWFPSPEGAIQRAPQPWSPHHKASPPMLFLYVELIHSAPVKYENSIHYVFTLWVMRFLCFLNMVSLSWFSCSQPYVRATLLFLYSSSSSQPRSSFFPKILPRGAFFFLDNKSKLDMLSWNDLFVWSLFHDSTLIYIVTILFE